MVDTFLLPVIKFAAQGDHQDMNQIQFPPCVWPSPFSHLEVEPLSLYNACRFSAVVSPFPLFNVAWVHNAPFNLISSIISTRSQLACSDAPQCWICPSCSQTVWRFCSLWLFIWCFIRFENLPVCLISFSPGKCLFFLIQG